MNEVQDLVLPYLDADGSWVHVGNLMLVSKVWHGEIHKLSDEKVLKRALRLREDAGVRVRILACESRIRPSHVHLEVRAKFWTAGPGTLCGVQVEINVTGCYLREAEGCLWTDKRLALLDEAVCGVAKMTMFVYLQRCDQANRAAIKARFPHWRWRCAFIRHD